MIELQNFIIHLKYVCYAFQEENTIYVRCHNDRKLTIVYDTEKEASIAMQKFNNTLSYYVRGGRI